MPYSGAYGMLIQTSLEENHVASDGHGAFPPERIRTEERSIWSLQHRHFRISAPQEQTTLAKRPG